MDQPRIRKPRCFLVYTLAPAGLTAAEANRQLNAFIADRTLPLALYHDHFIGRAGGLVIFYVESVEQQKALYAACDGLEGWEVDVRPLIYSYSPAAFDAQIGFTLRAYRRISWETLRREKQAARRNPNQEAETAREVD